ncbi:MAG: neutral zinc metallopeptidase [Thiotrichales bacterium]
MRLGNSRRSENLEDRRGASGGSRTARRGGLGLGAVALAVIASYFLGLDPTQVLRALSGTMTSTEQEVPSTRSPAEDAKAVFVSKILAETEDTWSGVFSAAGERYREPKLVLFTGATDTACGMGQRAMGPFYCPADQTVYIDLAFYDELTKRFNAPGEFAQAYVIAHEIGHHIQHQLGITTKVQKLQARSDEVTANALSVRLELQADCLAGMWAKRTDAAKQILEPGEIEQALNAAAAIGDDRMQKRAQGYAVPDSFTHGSSQQRMRWFKRGIDNGDFQQCDTFAAEQI